MSDRLNPSAPARTSSERTFDRTRYAYLALCLAALGRAGNQITLSELADHVAADAAQVDGVELSTDRASDRDAFVDAVGWLGVRGAIALADGDANAYNGGFRSGDPTTEAGYWFLPADATAADGTLYYVCEPHATMGMRGSIVVGAGDPEEPADDGESLDEGGLPGPGLLLVAGGMAAVALRRRR